MGKVYLLFVLSLVFIISISAQTTLQNAEKIVKTNDAKLTSETSEAKSESTKNTENIDNTENMDFQKTRFTAINNQALAINKEIAKISAIAGMTTGNATIDGYILAACARHNVDPLLIYAQMSQESSFKQGATSPKGASGLMQLMPATAARFGVSNIYNPKQNIEAGVKYMRWLLDEFGGDVKLALAGYNAGEGAVKKFGNQIPPYRETQNYVAKITAHYAKLKP